MSYLEFFGLQKEPFRKDLNVRELLCLPAMNAVRDRIRYTVETSGICTLTGDIGLGKSTALRWSCAVFHPSEVIVLPVVATSGSIAELYRSISWALGLAPQTLSRARFLKDIRETLVELVSLKKQKILLCLDEANLLRPEVLAELHTINQMDHDSRNLMAMVLCGQNTLLDKLQSRTAVALASRVIGRSHLEPLSHDMTAQYLAHHLATGKLKNSPFDDAAVTAIYQGSGGVPRRINGLARGGLMAAAAGKQHVVTAEHIRIAASELI
jgi:general secretion pathway protein A